MDGTHLPIYARDPNAEIPPKLPSQFGKMTDIAKNLSKGHKHLRVDFYEIGSSVYVGEMIFYHNSGFSEFHPHEWNVKIGDMISII